MEKFGVDQFVQLADNRLIINDTGVSDESIPHEYARLLSAIDGEINIMYSGGIDSEIVAETCKRYNIAHNLHFLALVNQGKIYNREDYDNAMQYDPNTVVHELDFERFFGNDDHVEYALKYKTQSPQLACHMHAAERVGSNVVFGGDSMFFCRDKTVNSFVFYATHVGHFCYNRAAQEFGGIGNMANASYSLLMKYLRLQIEMSRTGNIRETWVERAVNMQQHNYPWKCELYRRAGFQSLPKQNKLTGFEAIRAYYSDKYKEIGTCRKFNELYREPLVRIVNIPPMSNIILTLTEEIKTLFAEFGENYDKSR